MSGLKSFKRNGIFYFKKPSTRWDKAMCEISSWDVLGVGDVDRVVRSKDFFDGFCRGRDRVIEIFQKYGFDKEKEVVLNE